MIQDTDKCTPNEFSKLAENNQQELHRERRKRAEQQAEHMVEHKLCFL